MTATLVNAVVGVGTRNGPGDDVYCTPNEYKPAVWPVPLGAGRKPVRRRDVEAASVEELVSNVCPLKLVATVGESGGPKKPPSIVNGTPPVWPSVACSKLPGVEPTIVGRTGTMSSGNGPPVTLTEGLLVVTCTV